MTSTATTAGTDGGKPVQWTDLSGEGLRATPPEGSRPRRKAEQTDLFDQAYLAAEPWQPAPGIVVGRDRFVVTRQAHVCFECKSPIGAGARVRARAEIDRIGHQAVTFYFCMHCCRRMAAGERRSA